MPDTAELTHSDIEAAVVELSALSGVPADQLWPAVRDQAGGERDTASLAFGVQVVAASIEEAQGEYFGLAAAGLSAGERRALAAKGHALPNGSYPIPDEEHLHAAAVLAASGHGDVSGARALIRKRARELGVDVTTLPGFGSNGGDSDDEDQAVAASYSDREMVDAYLASYPPSTFYAWTGQPEPVALTAPDGDPGRFDPYSEVDNEVLRLAAGSPRAAQMFGLELAAPDYGGHTGAPGTGGPDEIMARHRDILGARPDRGSVKREGRGHHRYCPPNCSRDHRQPAEGGSVHPDVDRYLDMAAKAMGNRERPHGNATTSHPLSRAALESAERAARPGHTGYR